MDDLVTNALPNPADLFSLADRRALVTGGAEGMGREIARTLAGAGARVMIADINSSGARSTAEEIVAAGGDALGIAMDQGSPEHIEAAVAGTAEQLGGLDILVNNAAIQDRALFDDTGADMLDRLYAVNLRGPFLCLRAAARVMSASRGGGAVVNIGSLGGTVPLLPGLAGYNAMKAALHSITRQAAFELGGANIRVNAVLPGPVPTEGSMRAPGPLDRDRMMAKMPLPAGRMGTTTDIAAATLYLASAAAGYCTGTLLVVDGGLSLL